MANVLKNSTLLEISIVDKGASGDGEDRPRIVIAKRDTESNMPALEPVLAKLSPEDQATVLAALEAAAAPAEPVAPAPPAMPEKAEDEPAPPPPAADPEEDKPMEVAKALEKCSEKDQAAVLEAIEKRDILEKRVAELEAEKDRAKFTTIAKSMDALPGMKTDDRASLLMSISKSLDSGAYAQIEKQLKDAADIIAKSASMGELGSSASDPADASERLRAIAKSIRENTDLTAEQALVKAAEQNPELYAEQTKR